LLVIVSVGVLFNNVTLFYIVGFPVSLTTFLAAILLILGMSDWLKGGPFFRLPRIALLAFLLVAYEGLVHGLVENGISEGEWVRSFCLLVFNAVFLSDLSRFRVGVHEMRILSRIVAFVALAMGGLGVLQFLLSNLQDYPVRFLPLGIVQRVTDLSSDATRFRSLLRADGISYEPSFYGLGMATLTALCLVLSYLCPVGIEPALARLLRAGAVTALLGVMVSVALTAWMVLAIFLFVLLILPAFRSASGRLRVRVVLGLLCVVALAMLVLYPYLEPRIGRFVSGQDTSAWRRLVQIELIALPGDSIQTNVLGVGVGSEAKSTRLHQVVGSLELVPEEVTILNSLAYVSVTMGWIGLVLNGLLVFVAVSNSRCKAMTFRWQFIVLILGILFNYGRYLSPEWWALLALLHSLGGLSAASVGISYRAMVAAGRVSVTRPGA
jgi:hypothetical protein